MFQIWTAKTASDATYLLWSYLLGESKNIRLKRKAEREEIWAVVVLLMDMNISGARAWAPTSC